MSEATPDFASMLRPRDESRIRVERWRSEIPLVLVTAMVSLAIWILAVVTIVGLVYAVLMGVFFFVAHVRANGVRLAQGQFPELHGAARSTRSRRSSSGRTPSCPLCGDNGL